MTGSIQVTLTASYQELITIVNNARTALGSPQAALTMESFRELNVTADPSNATGISYTRSTIDGHSINTLLAGDSIPRSSGNQVQSESMRGIYFKGNGLLLNVDWST